MRSCLKQDKKKKEASSFSLTIKNFFWRSFCGIHINGRWRLPKGDHVSAVAVFQPRCRREPIIVSSDRGNYSQTVFKASCLGIGSSLFRFEGRIKNLENIGNLII